MNKVIFWHIYTVNNYQLIVQEQLFKLLTSGLYEEVETIYVGVTSLTEASRLWISNLLSDYSKIQITYHTENKEEKSTMRMLCDYAKENDSYILYFHTKGVTRLDYKTTLWRWSMEYHSISIWKECVSKLDEGYDAVGINVRYDTYIGYFPHFSGTFWWSKSSYINTLDETYLYTNKILEGIYNRYLVEFYIGSNHLGKLHSMFECRSTSTHSVETNINEYIKKI
jgi:hypothetical protein